MNIKRRLSLALWPYLCLLSSTVAQETAVQIKAVQPEVQTAQWAVPWWMPRHEEKLKELGDREAVDLLMIGDSITHGWEESGKEVWDKYYAKRNALNIGFSGDRTEQVLWRLDHGEIDGIAPKTAVVMIGTNNTGHRQDDPDETAAGIKALEPTLAKLLGEKENENHVRTVGVLTIGNSFAQNACRYLNDIANSEGSVRFVIGTANIGGCTLEQHASLAAQSQSDPSVKPYKDVRGDKETKYSLQEYLQADQWDYVTLQQMSALSYKPESFHPHIERLSAIVRKYAPDARILIHQTWAYRPDSPLLKEDNLSQQQMYERLEKAYAAVAKKLGSRIIPVGTAFQLARQVEGREVLVRDPNFDFDNPVYPNLPKQTNSLVVGWYWTKNGDKPQLSLDYKHGNTAGCYLAGLVWYEALTGNDARETTYVPKGLDQSDAAFFREIAHLAAKKPGIDHSAK